jgi:hypothetical protein
MAEVGSARASNSCDIKPILKRRLNASTMEMTSNQLGAIITRVTALCQRPDTLQSSRNVALLPLITEYLPIVTTCGSTAL